jgi:hypothetical protein
MLSHDLKLCHLDRKNGLIVRVLNHISLLIDAELNPFTILFKGRFIDGLAVGCSFVNLSNRSRASARFSTGMVRGTDLRNWDRFHKPKRRNFLLFALFT